MKNDPEINIKKENIEDSFRQSKSLLNLNTFCASCEQYNTFPFMNDENKKKKFSKKFLIPIIILFIVLPFLILFIPLMLLVSAFINSRIKQNSDEVCNHCKEIGGYINLRTKEGKKNIYK